MILPKKLREKIWFGYFHSSDFSPLSLPYDYFAETRKDTATSALEVSTAVRKVNVTLKKNNSLNL